MDMLIELFKNHQQELIVLGKNLLLSLLVLLLSWLVCRFVRRMIDRAMSKIEKLDPSIANIFYSVARVFIWLFAVLIILDRFGVNTASILTVLGAAGLAVGLAMKDSLSNIAAGLMLLVLRPYRSGDYVDCSSVSGTIRQIGLFATELITVDGMYILVPNSAILTSPVKNYSRNPLRRGDITVGIAYSDSLTVGVDVLLELLKSNEKIMKEPAPEVLVAELADNSVNLTLRFWTANADYWDVYWQVKKQLKPAVEAAGLTIPFPQRVITLTSMPEMLKK
ncbi:MAG: mechanosensitive ion channel [Lentisphaerae bacterium]|nr:mechanosensitive ion channel [Lentisphaerota bacterium]